MARRVVLLGLLLLLSLWPGRVRAQTTTAQQTTMPDVIGMTESQARTRLQRLQLAVEVTATASAQPQGMVVSQRPEAGTAIKQGARVVLGVSRGPDQRTDPQPRPDGDGQASSRETTVPDLAGMTPTLARIALIARRLVPGSIDSADAPGIRAGRVVGQRPAAGAVVPPGTRVQLTLARRARDAVPPAPQPPAPDPPAAPESNLVAVPDLAGRTVADARRATGAARLLLGTVDSVATSGVAGTVVRQRPAAGAMVAPGTFVTITIVQGLVTVPRLAGRTPSEARGALRRAGLRAGPITEREAPGPISVLEQSVPAGSLVAAGTSVSVVISRPPAAPVVPPAPPPAPVPSTDTPAVQVAPPPPAPPVVDSAPPVQADSVVPLPPAVTPPPAADTPAAPQPPIDAEVPRPTPDGSGMAVRWEWLAALAALLLALAAGWTLRSRMRPAPKPVAAPLVVPTVAVRMGSGETASTAAAPEQPLGEGRVKIGMIAGETVAPEPVAGASVLTPARLAVRMEAADAVAEGAPPERIMAGAPLRVQMYGEEPTLERDEGSVILKRR